MTINTKQSVTGFIATDPQLSTTEVGEARFFARFGQDNFRHEEDGSFTKLEPTFSNLVLYRTTAERAYERFVKGDQFVAEGYVHPYEYERDGQNFAGEEFVATKIGHDTAQTRYTVDRSPRTPAQSTPSSKLSRAFDSPQQRPGNDAPGLGR